MGFMDEYYKALQEEKQKSGSGSAGVSGGSSFMDEYYKAIGSVNTAPTTNNFNNFNSFRVYEAPLSERIASRTTVGKKKKKEEEEERKWFQKGLFEDGYDFGDVTKTILGTVTDTVENVGSGIMGMGEKAIDALAWMAPAMENAQFYQNGGGYNLELEKAHKQAVEASKKGINEFIAKDLYDEEAIAKTIITKPTENFFKINVEDSSVFGEKSDALIQSAGQLAAQYGMTAVGVPWFVTSGLTSFGSETENALKQGATYEQAGASAAISAGAEVLSEKLFGGDVFVGKSGSDLATTYLSRAISNKALRTMAKLGIDTAGESFEEVFSEAMSNLGSSLYKEEDLVEILFNEEALEGYLEAAIGGGVLGGAMGGINAVQSGKAGQDFTSGLTSNEETVVQKVYKDRVAEAEKEGKISQYKKNKIYDQVVSEMDKGYISIDDIESALGGKTYEDYKRISEWEDSLQKEYDDLHAMKRGDMTGEQLDREAHLKEQLKNVKATSGRDALKSQLREEVFGLVKGDRLVESYNERNRRGQKFEADLTQYDAKQQAVVQKAIDSGILNNTNRTHEFVDMIAKISADKGVPFDFTNNAKLKESGFAVDGKQVNGFVTKDGISLNIDSPKALQSTVGHEITHVLEGTELYAELQNTIAEYAKSKGEYDSRRNALAELYKDIKDADIDKELTADLVGDYLFGDIDFINNLSVNNRNVFQKMWDEVKYLCKVATAGSKEARELEKVKRAFEKAYRESGKTQGETKYSVSDSNGKQLTKEQQDYFKDSKARDENGNLIKVYHSSPTAGFTVFYGSEGEGNYKYGDYGDSITFFTDNKAMADSYSPSSEKVDTKKLNTIAEAEEWLESIGIADYDIKQGNGNYKLIDYDEGSVVEFESEEHFLRDLKRIVQEQYGDIHAGGQYEGYVNLKNPLIVDAEGRPWDRVTDEYSQEVYDKFQSLTEEERAALIDLAEWEDFSLFRKEISDGADLYEMGRENDHTRIMASIAEKMYDTEPFVDPYQLFDVAADAFSEEVVKEKSTIQLSTNDYVERALQAGTYDGVIIKNVIDYGGYAHSTLSSPPGNDYIVFNSNQFKAADNLKPTADPDIRYSLGEVTEEQNQKGLDRKNEVTFSLSNDTAYMEKAIAKNNSMMQVDSSVLEETKALRERIAARMNAIKDRGLVGLPEDIEGSTYIANSSYDGTEENTTICPRSLASEAFVDAVSEYLGRPLTVEEQIYISQDLQGRSLTPECTYCYVATDRKAYRAFLGEYINQRDAVLQKIEANPNADVSRSGELYKEFLGGRKDTSPMYNRFKMWVDAYKNGKPLIDASHLANINKLMGDINSEFGAELKPQITDAMKYAQSASWAKKRVNYVAYNGHILKWKQDRINKLNSHYGLRMYSFSDFHPAFVLENMQMITDASVRGLKMLGYTKDTDFVEIFAPSGMNINVSTFGFEVGGEVFENNLIGAEWEKAKALREQYPNVGVTFVATNDTLVDWALSQDWIDVVIPYHLVRTGAEVAKAFNYTNYTSESSDTKTKDWKKGDKKYIAPTEHNNDKATYLAALEKNHLNPRFERFINNPNYMKLVNECRQSAAESKPVQPIFNEDAAMVALAKLEANGYYQPIGGSVDRMYEIAGEVAEAMTKELAPTMSISNEGQTHKQYGNWNVYAKDILLENNDIAPTAETSEVVAENETTAPTVAKNETVPPTVSKTERVAPVPKEEQPIDIAPTAEDMQTMFPDDAVPVQEELEQLINERDELYGALEVAVERGTAAEVGELAKEYEALNARIKALEAEDAERIGSLTEAPPEMEAPYYESTPDTVSDPFFERDWDSVGKRNVKAYMYENPEVKPFFQQEAMAMLGELNDTQKGERIYNDQLHYDSGGEKGWFGIKRLTSESIETLLDGWGMSYAEIEKGLNAIIEDNGAENIAAAKKIEFMLNDRLLNGYKDFYTNDRIEPNQGYIELLNQKQITEYSKEAFDSFMANAEQYAPSLDEQYAPILNSDPRYEKTVPTYDRANGQQTYIPNGATYNAVPTDDIAPTMNALGSSEVPGQQTFNQNKATYDTAPIDDAPTLFDATGKKGVPDGQQAFTEDAGVDRKVTRKEYHQGIMDNIRAVFKAEGYDFDEVLKNAKNLSTWSTVDNTPQRVMEKALGYKEGGILADLTVNKVAQNETEGIKWLNAYVDQIKKISKQYGVKPGSKESAAAQMYAEGFYVNENNEIISYGYPELVQDFGNAVARRIVGLARDTRIRKIYDDALTRINESRTRNLYPEIQKLDNYFLHFRAMADTFSTLGLPFNPNDIKAKDLPTDLNGVTADLKPGQPYFASANHRTGKRTSFDLLGGLERYLNSAKNQIFHIDDIQTLRALRNEIANTYGQAHGLENLDELSQDAQFEQIKKVYDSHLSTFAKFLNEEANILAGKTALIDRGLEGIIGRRGITFLNTLNRQVGSNMVGYNVSSSLTNFLPVAQTFAKTNKFDFVKAFAQTVANKVSRGRFDSFAEDSPVVIRRKGEDRFYRTPWQKIADPGYALMGAVDDISTELIARTKYNEFIRKGMDSQKAHFETDKWVSKLMGDRSLGQQPQLYNSKMLGLVTKFQLEVRNQLDSQFYDTIQETKVSNEHIQNGLARNAKTAAQVTSTFVQLAVAQHLFGKAFESMAGYNPAFDIIEVLMTAFGFDDEEDSEDTALDNIEQGFLALLEDLPYVGTLTGGGRIPISSALPIKELVYGEDQYGNDKSRLETAAEVAPYYLLPGGYGQIKKTVQGLGMFSDEHPIAGSYTEAGNLRFPVEDTVGNRIKAGVFGQYASENARKYFDQEQRTLNPEQTEILAGLDIPVEEYWEYRDSLNEFYDAKDKVMDAAFADGATDEAVLMGRYIDAINDEIYDLYDQQKKIASGNSQNKTVELRKLQKQMEQLLSDSQYAEYSTYVSGAYAEVGDRRYNKDADSGRWYEIKPKNADGSDNWYYQKEQEVTKGLGISSEQYWNNRDEYNYAYDKPGRYAIAQAVGGYDTYMKHYDALENWQSDSYLAADKDSDGNSISGSRKEKVIDYINGLDMDYGERIILYRTVYSSKADKKAYNQDIIDYLNGRDDISAQEMRSILEELDFKVDSEGYITW